MKSNFQIDYVNIEYMRMRTAGHRIETKIKFIFERIENTPLRPRADHVLYHFPIIVMVFISKFYSIAWMKLHRTQNTHFPKHTHINDIYELIYVHIANFT